MRSRRPFHSALISRAILIGAALLVPRSEREEWLAEWTSELWYFLHASGPDPASPPRFSRSMARFCLGSFRDTIWLRRNNPDLTRNQLPWLRSPIQCAAFLVFLAVLTSLIAFLESVLQPPYTGCQFMLGQLLVLGTALLILPATTTFALGEYPSTLHSPTRAARLHRWMFLGVKVALILPIVFCGTLDLGPIIASAGVRPQATLIGYVLAFRWALIDQRRRCPVCLRLLTNPIRIGQPSHIMLDWYGTELMCSRGHGFLHVPETPTSSYSTQRWLQLDSSWKSLFS
ncbi:MAG: hypothetical protein ACR2JB_06345 [Bryobacteraceae bacterium]